MQRYLLCGLDFGSTTSRSLFVEAELFQSKVTGLTQVRTGRILFSNPPQFTPFLDQTTLDEKKILALAKQWLAQIPASLQSKTLGGALLFTGLAADSPNVSDIVSQLQQHLPDALVFRAKDPRYESWLAFQGSVGRLSKAHPEKTFLNLDVGGGTTNLAIGKAGEVHFTDCFPIGARHLQFKPGTYGLNSISPVAKPVISAQPGQTLTPDQRQTLLSHYRQQIKSALETLPPIDVLTFSGGVGELIYQIAEQKTDLPTTPYGDLGYDLAQDWLTHWPFPCDKATSLRYQPQQKGRATVIGLSQYSTQFSGNTIFIDDSVTLPLNELPVTGTIRTPDDIATQLPELDTDFCVHLDPKVIGTEAADLRRLGTQLRQTLLSLKKPHTRLVLLVPSNVGHILGNYLTNWRQDPHPVVVLDEIAYRSARFVSIGSKREGLVPVSFYGF